MLSAKVFADKSMDANRRMVLSLNHLIPQEFVKIYKKNVVGITPRKNSGLRRSITTQTLGKQAVISWRSKYAGAQQAGQMTVHRKRVVNIDGRFVTLMPGVYRFRKYTTAGTGSNFAQTALQMTKESFIEEFYKAHPELR